MQRPWSEVLEDLSRMSQGKRTYAELDRLLAVLEFKMAQAADRSKTYWHEASDTIILIPAARQSAELTESDLASVQSHLTGRGLLPPPAFDAFLATGALPAN